MRQGARRRAPSIAPASTSSTRRSGRPPKLEGHVRKGLSAKTFRRHHDRDSRRTAVLLAEDYHQQYLAKNPMGYCGLGGTGVSCPIGTGVAAAH